MLFLQWEEISRIRLLEMKIESRHCLAIAVSRTHPSVFRRSVPFEPKPQSTSAISRHKVLTLIMNAFAKSARVEGFSKFSLGSLVNWLVSTSSDDMHSMIKNVFEQEDPDIDVDGVNRCDYVLV